MNSQHITGYIRKFIWLGALILVILMLASTIRNVSRVMRVRSEVEAQRQKVEKIEKENEEIKRKIEETSGLEFIEREVRNKLGLVKEGEAVVVLPDEETLRKLAPKIDPETDNLPDPNWKKWLKLFI